MLGPPSPSLESVSISRTNLLLVSLISLIVNASTDETEFFLVYIENLCVVTIFSSIIGVRVSFVSAIGVTSSAI